MIRIKTVSLKNFQAHKDTTIELDKGVTILGGESSEGKTSILRGIMWLMTNRPSGIGFVSNWAKETNSKGDTVLKKGEVCSVTLVIESEDKEHTITRLRSRDDNVYLVDGVKLEAVGTSVPEEVVGLLTMHECNVQSQDDQYFMLTLPSGQIASKLNELVHLDSIDKAFEYTKKCKSANSAIYKEWDGLYASYRLKLDGMKHLPDLISLEDEVNSLLLKYEDSVKALESLEGIEGRLHTINNSLNELPSVSADEQVDKLHDYIENINEVEESYESMCTLKQQLENTITALDRLPDCAEEDIDSVSSIISRHTDSIEDLHDMERIYSTLSTMDSNLAELTNKINKLAEQLPASCPLCGSTIDKEIL